jgi:hypothetical protein
MQEPERAEIRDRFSLCFGCRASTTPDGWPAMDEPTPSVTFDLGQIPDGAHRGASYDAINAEALRAFVLALPSGSELLVLDWQHPAYRLRPSQLAFAWEPEWPVPVYPDGDYFAFLVPDLTAGAFGHPWEKTLCVFGDPFVDSLARTLSTWLPPKRANGQPIIT